MRLVSQRSGGLVLLAALPLPVSVSLSAQEQASSDPNILVTGDALPDTSAMTAGPEIKGIITARSGDKMKVTAADGTGTVIFINDATKIKASSGLFGGTKSKLGATSLLNGI